MFHRFLYLTFSLLVFYGCTSSNTDTTTASVTRSTQKSLQAENVYALAALMEGTFQTAPEDTENIIRDRRVKLASASLEGVWFYYQLNTGKEWSVYRQRIVQLTAGENNTVRQITYGVKNPGNFVDAWKKPTLLNTLSKDDIEPYFDGGCVQIWTQTPDNVWNGRVDANTCKIFSERRQANIGIEAESRLDGSSYYQTERGYDEQGEQIFGSEVGEFIQLYRQ